MKLSSILIVATAAAASALPVVYSSAEAREAHRAQPWHKFGIGANTIFVAWGAYADYPKPDEYNNWKEKEKKN